MRCLALADALTARGVASTFVCASVPRGLASLVRGAGHVLMEIEPAHPGWAPGLAFTADAQAVDAARTLEVLDGRQAAWLVLDHYALAAPWARAMEPLTARRLVLDDLADREHDCDLLLDQTFGRAASDYGGLVPADCRILVGPRHALLRPEFQLARPMALARRRQARPVERLLLSLGATDVGGVTQQALAAVRAAGVGCAIDVVLTSSAPSLEAVEAVAVRDSRVVLHVDTDEMASLMSAADLAVGAAGTSSWERCCLGLPTVALALADNQRFVAEQLQSTGALTAVSALTGVTQAVRAAAADAALRASMTAAAAALTDGRGADAVVDVMLDLEGPSAPPLTRERLTMRSAGPGDVEPLWLWRNDSTTRAMAKSHEPIPWATHEAWFAGACMSEGSSVLVVEANGRAAAVLRFDDVAEGALVSINVDPVCRGQGVGTMALALSCEMHERLKPQTPLVAEILPSNAASRRAFESNGFCSVGFSGGLLRYVRNRQV